MNQVSEFDPKAKVQPIVQPKQNSSLWEMRTEEQPYAFLSDKQNQDENRYGQKINLREVNTGWAEDQSMFINGNPEVGCNPNRNKQHAFFFTADNCIGCHACEAACSEKNDNPGHIAFRSVGYVEGGTYPDYKRMNISMACNHCDDPVCLKGCPTNAYTKHTEYGAVLQDPETCFGCGYCTWVCPYNAPQLDPVKGQVSKCNMCVDRLEVGLKPACVSACLGNALDFGVVENIPLFREEAKVSIPGFPDPEITHPNIRFQQTRSMPEEVTRTDSMPIKYHRDETGSYKPRVDQKVGKVKYWNLARLSSRENPLVLFTLLTQAAIGAFTLLFAGSLLGLESMNLLRSSPVYALLCIASFMMVSLGMFMSTTHLGKPMRFYRGFNNLRYSPVCREGFGIAVFIGMLGLHILFSLPANSIFQTLWQWLFDSAITDLVNVTTAHAVANVCGVLALLGAAGGLYYMYRCYRIKARPFWNHWQVATDFGGWALALGAALIGSAALIWQWLQGSDVTAVLMLSAAAIAAGMFMHAMGLKAHSSDMSGKDHEGAVSYYIQTTTFGKTFLARNWLVGINIVLALAVVRSGEASVLSSSLWAVLMLSMLCSSLMGRALFYVLVVPTTMPVLFSGKTKALKNMRAT